MAKQKNKPVVKKESSTKKKDDGLKGPETINLIEVIDNKIKELDEQKVSESTIVVEDPKPLTERDLRGIWLNEMKLFVHKMEHSGRARLRGDEMAELEMLYNRWYGLNEKIGRCDLCCIRMFSRIKKACGA